LIRVGKFHLETILLSTLSGGLLVLLALVWHWGQNRVHEPQRLAVRNLAPPDLSVLDSTPRANIDVAAIRDNAVFHTQRTYFLPLPASQPIAPPEYEFAGSMSLPQGKRVAYIKKKSDRSSRTVHVGDDLDGWQVELIDGSRVVIAHDSQRVEIKANAVALESGLVHSAVTSHIAQSGIQVIGGQGPVPLRPSPAQVSVARTFTPPPPRH
jgi:hypothetical protein